MTENKLLARFLVWHMPFCSGNEWATGKKPTEPRANITYKISGLKYSRNLPKKIAVIA